MPTPERQIKWINFNQMIFADTVKHHCWEDWPPQTGPEKAGQDTAHTHNQPLSVVQIKILKGCGPPLHNLTNSK